MEERHALLDIRSSGFVAIEEHRYLLVQKQKIFTLTSNFHFR